MKYKTTRKAIVAGTPANNLVCAGYCDLSNLLWGHEPIAYTSGVYGWNFDVYEVYGKTICTGYRNMPGRKANNEAAYEEKARAISDNYDLKWEERRDKIESLLKEFCEQA